MLDTTRILLWRALAVLAVVLAVIGAILPVMPTVPFLLVAAWAGGKGWPALEARLLAHPTWGPPIQQWRSQGAISRKAKYLAFSMMGCSALVLWFTPVPAWVRGMVYLIMLSVATWMWHLPEPAPVTTA